MDPPYRKGARQATKIQPGFYFFLAASGRPGYRVLMDEPEKETKTGQEDPWVTWDAVSDTDFETSRTIGALAGSLSIAQGKIEGAKKDTDNPFFKSKYADLASVWDAIRQPLADNGLAVVQAPGKVKDGYVSVTTMLIHKSGEWLKAKCTGPLSKQDVQGMGSAITYLRRYSLSAVTGVFQIDDDGESAVDRAPTAASKPIVQGYRPQSR